MLSQPLYLNLEYFYYLIYRLLTKLWMLGSVPVWLPFLCFGLIFILIVVIVTLTAKIINLRGAERHQLRLMLEEGKKEKPKQNERWESIQKYLESENVAEWKLAVIEADNMLDDLVRTLNSQGENLGERLKAIEPSDFETLQDAWEAHKVRNQIAHETDFVLTRREMMRVIGHFKKVFEEFEYI